MVQMFGWSSDDARARFAFKSFQVGFFGGEFRRENLDNDRATQFGVVAL